MASCRTLRLGADQKPSARIADCVRIKAIRTQSAISDKIRLQAAFAFIHNRISATDGVYP
jgi:hypothetical protein